MNRNSGGGVEFEGNLFIEILKRTTGITSIDIYKTQCQQQFKEFDFSVYDLIILNDLTMKNYDNKKFADVPVININFGGTSNRSKVVDIVLDINMPYTSYYEDLMFNYYPINFISGNIWDDYKQWEDRSDDILYIARLGKEKIVPEFLDYVRSTDRTINFYGIIYDNDYYEKNKDVIDYKGCINHRKLLKIYNEYKNVYLFSTTECLSMTIRESILCGTVPVVYDSINYTKAIEEYIIKFKNVREINSYPIIEQSNRVRKKIEEDRKYLQNYLSFDKMILDFIFCLRGLLLKDFRFDKHYEAVVNTLQDLNGDPYENDTIDWDKISL